jgi:hypothetical protein
LDKETLELRKGEVEDLLLFVLSLFGGSVPAADNVWHRLARDINSSHLRRAARSVSRSFRNKDDDKDDIKALSDRLTQAIERYGVSLNQFVFWVVNLSSQFISDYVVNSGKATPEHHA